jgi:hypothetical protein
VFVENLKVKIKDLAQAYSECLQNIKIQVQNKNNRKNTSSSIISYILKVYIQLFVHLNAKEKN